MGSDIGTGSRLVHCCTLSLCYLSAEMIHLVGDQLGVGVSGIFARFTALALELHDIAPTNGQKNLGQLFARFLTELLTEADDGQLVGWTTRQEL